MSTPAKYKWIASLILGGILLILAFAGGTWQVTYAADEVINQVPFIDHIFPSAVPAGSANKVMVIFGSNFGTSESDVRVWIQDATHDLYLTPVTVLDNGISVVITDTLMINPTLYTIKVVRSNGLSVPTNPPWTPYDQVSNSVDFLVYQPLYWPLPIVYR